MWGEASSFRRDVLDWEFDVSVAQKRRRLMRWAVRVCAACWATVTGWLVKKGLSTLSRSPNLATLAAASTGGFCEMPTFG